MGRRKSYRKRKLEAADRNREDRNKTPLDRLREVAASRGQTIREYVPAAKPEPVTPKTETTEGPTTKQPPWVRGPLPPWAKRWGPLSDVRSLLGEQIMAQRIVLIIGFVLILSMALFPPWKELYDVNDLRTDRIVHQERAAGYHLIVRDQMPQRQYGVLRIDTTRLGVQFIAVLVLTAFLYLMFRPAK